MTKARPQNENKALSRWSPLMHAVNQLWKKHSELPQGKLLVGWSGGADSTALLHVLSKISSAIQCEIHAVTIHHGPGVWAEARDRMVKFCFEHSQNQPWTWEVIRSEVELKSELEMRNFRRESLRQLMKKQDAKAFVFGHHADDLLETRLLRLMRGTGEKGLPAMQLWRAPVLRPFLEFSRKEIQAELVRDGIAWFEDPSNQGLQPLRNWVRHELIPLMDRRDPAILKGISRSLAQLMEVEDSIPPIIWSENGIRLREWSFLDSHRKRLAIGLYLNKLDVRDFRLTQIKEIIKHLDKNQNEHTFKVASCLWHVNAGHVIAQPHERSRTPRESGE